MKNKKEKKLWVLLILIIIIIISFSIFLIFKKISINSSDYEKLYGTWNGFYNEFFSNNELKMKGDISDKLIKIYDNNNIEICYFKEYELICETKSYSYDGKVISIEQNNFYLKGEYYIEFVDGYMILSQKIKTINGNDEIKLYFSLSNKDDLKYNYNSNASIWTYSDGFSYDLNDNKESLNDIELFSLVFYADELKVFYNQNEFITSKYSYENNNLFIEENDYFSGKFTINYNEIYMIFERKLENGNKNVYYFVRPV